MAEQRYRYTTITVTALCLALAALTVWFEFAIFSDYRTKDFTKVSEGPIEGTCVEAVVDEQLKSAWYDKSDWDCSDGNKDKLSNLLAVSIHALYYKNSQAALDAEGTRVLNSLISTTQGVAAHQITKTQAYNALKDLGTPATDCGVIYAGATELTTKPNPIAPSVVCDSVTPTDGTPEAADTDKLFTHCLAQFSYGRSGDADGTFSIPKVGESPDPMILPVLGTNSSTTWSDRARILVGTRWGYSTVVYVIFVMTSAFFFLDCAIFLLAELTRVDAYFAQNAVTEGNRSAMKEGVCFGGASRAMALPLNPAHL